RGTIYRAPLRSPIIWSCPTSSQRSRCITRGLHDLVPVTIMITVIPVTLFMPATLMFIPPSVSVFPAPFPCLAEFVPLVVCLPAVVSVLFDRTIQLVVRMSQFSFAIVACLRPWHSREKRACCEHHCPANKSCQSRFPSIGKHRSFAS